MDEQTATELVVAMVSTVVERGGYITKTKLLKLLYLFDIEYYRAHGKTFTNFTWKFYHLGPWASEYDPAISAILAKGALTQRFGKHNTPIYGASEPSEISALLMSISDKTALGSVLRRWAQSDTNELLDYVYFNTAPMLVGVRGQPLDFSAIQPLAPVYQRPSSGTNPKEVVRKREAFKKKLAAAKLNQKPAMVTAPRYDEDFDKAMSILQSD